MDHMIRAAIEGWCFLKEDEMDDTMFANPCAVKDCPRNGAPQVCPYDQAYHPHGRVHYGSPGTPHDMQFRVGWRQVCAEHYDMLRRAREAWERDHQRETAQETA